MMEGREKGERLKPTFKLELKKCIEKTKSDTKNLTKEINEPMFLHSEEDIDWTLDRLQNLQDKIENIKENVAQCQSIQQALETDPVLFDYVDEAVIEIELRRDLWLSLRQIKAYLNELKTTEFNSLDRQKIENVTEFHSKILLRCESRGYKDTSAVQELKKAVLLLKNALPVIESLSNPQLKSDHWEEIKKILDTDLQLENKKFTIDELLKLDHIKHSETIRNISMSASQESSIKKQLKLVKQKWEKRGFVFKQYFRESQREQVTIIGESNILFIDLDETMTTINTMLGSTLGKRLFGKIILLKQQFDLLWNVVEEWMHCQRNWLYLDSIFSSSDIRSHLKKETADFETVDKQWRQIMRTVIVQSKNILLNYATMEQFDKLARLNKQMDKIKKELQHYLETKRREFPRFYFISDSELLPIMSKSTSILAVEPILPKCFEGIAKLDVTLNKQMLEIAGIYSSEGEKMLFKTVKAFHDENVVAWLRHVEIQMFESLKKLVKSGYTEYFQGEVDRKKFILNHCAQVSFCVTQLLWTESCEYAIKEFSEDVTGLTELWQQCGSQIFQLVSALSDELSVWQRSSVTAIIIKDMHWRDVVEKLINNEISSIADFVWTSQLRYYLEEGLDCDEIHIRQLTFDSIYGYEYIGPSSKLVITPLTERCYMTITNALQLHMGTALTGPAGTGKTETVKDLAKAIAIHCVAFNCSEQMDNKIIGRLFSGVILQGAWACWDEFNRIDLDVLSVVAQMLLQVQDSLGSKKYNVIFNELEIKIKPTLGIFITLNPSYKSRIKLPDNLKSLFRPVAMIKPDACMVSEVTLYSQGFSTANILSKKLVNLFDYTEKQMSKQTHYDFSMRSIKVVVSYAGVLRNNEPELDESEILVKSIKYTTFSGLVSDDIPLVTRIIDDFFPEVSKKEEINDFNKEFIDSLSKVSRINDTNLTPGLSTKVQQLNESLKVRTGVMVIGKPGVGKTTCINLLLETLNDINYKKAEKTDCSGQETNISLHLIFPKSLSLGQLYGEELKETKEWRYGVISKTVRRVLKGKENGNKWIVFDGPIDPKWVEYLNSALDDNRMLCLANAERIKFPEKIRLLFEVFDLSCANPATISRCGMVYVSSEDIGWKAVIDAWLIKMSTKLDLLERSVELRTYLESLLGETVLKMIQTVERINTDVEVPGTIPQMIKGFTTRFTSLLNTVALADPLELRKRKVCWYLAFSLAWAFGGCLHNSGRQELDDALRMVLPKLQVPYTGTIFDFQIEITDTNNPIWTHWKESLVPQISDQNSESEEPIITPKISIKLPILNNEIYVETADSVKYQYLFNSSFRNDRPVFVTGCAGIGKSSMIKFLLKNKADTHVLPLVFSANTKAIETQNYLETRLEPKKGKTLLGPPGSTQGIIYVDDINMPLKENSPNPVEFIRQLISVHGFYGKSKLQWVKLMNMQILCCGTVNEYGRWELPERFLHLFDMFWISEPNQDMLKNIFETILREAMNKGVNSEDIQKIGSIISNASIELYTTICKTLKPVPAKFYYAFTTRDLSKLAYSLLMATPKSISNPESFIRLWIHESSKIFGDRLSNYDDIQFLQESIIKIINTRFRLEWSVPDIFQKQKIIFTDLHEFNSVKTEKSYEEIHDEKTLLKALELGLESYNTKNQNNKMHLVFFDDAVRYIISISRILRQKHGNCLLIGVSGSGKESSVLLSANMLDSIFSKIRISKNYKKENFREDIRNVMLLAGIKGKSVTFFLNEHQLSNEEFLDDVNSILTTGDINNLFLQDELDNIIKDITPVVLSLKRPETKESKYATFVERVKENLHIVLNMSPVGNIFRNNVRKYPSLLSCTNLIYFALWPEQAFESVCLKMAGDMEALEKPIREKLAQMFPKAHLMVSEIADLCYAEQKKKFYVTPKNFIDAIKFFSKQYNYIQANHKSAIERLGKGLKNFKTATHMVEQLHESLSKLQPIIQQNTIKTTSALALKELESKKAAEEEEKVESMKSKLYAQKTMIELAQAEAKKELDKVTPLLEEARLGLDTISAKEIAKIKSYLKPPKMVVIVMEAVKLLLTSDKKGWEGSKDLLNEKGFMKRIKEMSYTKIMRNTIKSLREYTLGFDMKEIGLVDTASVSLAKWCVAMEKCYDAYQKIVPQEEKLHKIEAEFKEKQKEVILMEEALEIIKQKLKQLEFENRKLSDEAHAIMEEKDRIAYQLANAELLARLLNDEGLRWNESVEKLKDQDKDILGNVFLSCAAISYSGPFEMKYREILMNNWKELCKSAGISYSPDYSIINTLGNQMEMKQWNLQGLPQDRISMENAILAIKSTRWPLFLDTEGQANKWVRNLEKNLVVTKILHDSAEFIKIVTNAVQLGQALLIEDIENDIDSSIYAVLGRKTFRSDGGEKVYIGNKDVLYDHNFRLYLTCKNSHPRFMPEIYTMLNVVNFAVTFEALEEQLLVEVILKERPELEAERTKQIIEISQYQRQLTEIEEEILERLTNATEETILMSVDLIKSLEKSKKNSNEIEKNMKDCQTVSNQMNSIREQYRTVATRGSVIYFVLLDLSKINCMYQFSFAWFKKMFINGLSAFNEISGTLSPGSRNKKTMEKITETVYEKISNGIFNCHITLLGFLLACSIKLREQIILPIEFDLFVKGINSHYARNEKKSATPSGSDTIKPFIKPKLLVNLSEMNYQFATILDSKIPLFRGILESMNTEPEQWLTFMNLPNPYQNIEKLQFSQEKHLTGFNKLLLIKITHPEKLIESCNQFIEETLGKYYTECRTTTIDFALKNSMPNIPVIFVLQDGMDLTYDIIKTSRNYAESDLHIISLGREQELRAEREIIECKKSGKWVLLQNCHLMKSFSPKLENIVVALGLDQTVHPNFRFLLTTNISETFPIAVLHLSTKYAIEQPNKIQPYLTALNEEYGKLAEGFNNLLYKKLFTRLCIFHATMQERCKFGTIGWNSVTQFNRSDFYATFIILNEFNNHTDANPFAGIEFITSVINYGGRVYDDFDQNVLNASFRRIVCENGNLKETSLINDANSIELIGLHENANVIYNMQTSENLIQNLIKLHHTYSKKKALSETKNDTIKEIIDKLIANMPPLIDPYLGKAEYSEINPFRAVLRHEIDVYNSLLKTISRSLNGLSNAIKGDTQITEELEELYANLSKNTVPKNWLIYDSVKPLMSWYMDLAARVGFLKRWRMDGLLRVYWISALIFPNAFMSALIQSYAHKYERNIESLKIQYEFSSVISPEHIKESPKIGAYIYGLYLEGANWNLSKKQLCDSVFGQLCVQMPVILLVPTEEKKHKNEYICPIYRTSKRKDGFIRTMELPTEENPDKWILRGTALLCELSE